MIVEQSYTEPIAVSVSRTVPLPFLPPHYSRRAAVEYFGTRRVDVDLGSTDALQIFTNKCEFNALIACLCWTSADANWGHPYFHLWIMMDVIAMLCEPVFFHDTVDAAWGDTYNQDYFEWLAVDPEL